MKATITSTAAAVALFAAIGANAVSAQTVDYTQGDLLIAFQANSGTGNTQTFVFNAGYTVDFRNDHTGGYAGGLVGNIGAQLESVYGENWFTRSELSWGAVGVRQPVGLYGPNPVIDGDAGATIYASRESLGGERNSAAWDPMIRGVAGSIATKITGFTHASAKVSGTFNKQDAAAGTDGRGAFIDAALANSWASHNDGNYSFGAFTGGLEGTFGRSGEFVYLDIYRVTPDGQLPTWVTTLTIDAAGNVYAVPEPSTYAALAAVAALGFVMVRRVRRNRVSA